MIDAADEEELTPLRDRLHAAHRALGVAYDTRDALAEEARDAGVGPGAVVRPELVLALASAERAVLAAEAEMKDAEYALAMAEDARAGRR